MPPLVIDLMQGWRADLLRGDEAMQREMAQRWLGVEQALNAQMDALTLELQRDGGRVTMGQLQRNRRYRALMGQVDDELRKYSRFVEGRIVDRQQALMNAAISHSQAAVSAVATEAEMLVQFNRLPVSAVENMVGLTGAGTPVRDILADASRDGPEGLTQELIDGIALGRNPVETARRALRLGLASSFTRMSTIARTETLRVYRQTTLEGYQRSNVVVGYRRLAARDRRTCIGCLFADGRQYTLNEPFDEHPAGRCAMVPVLRSVPPVQFETGQEWFKRQPESTQRAMLGPSRMDLWKRGEVSLDDLVTRRRDDTWGGALVPAPVRSLRGGQVALRRTAQATQATRRQDAARRAAKREAANEKRASELQLAWVNGSNSQQAIVLKHAVKRELSVTGDVWNPKGREAGDAEIEAARDAARMMYERTQQYFRTKGITKVRLYRGIQSDITGKNVVESWTTDLDTAQLFSKGYEVFEEEIPVERIFMAYGGPGWRDGKFGKQFEYIVLGSTPR